MRVGGRPKRNKVVRGYLGLKSGYCYLNNSVSGITVKIRFAV